MPPCPAPHFLLSRRPRQRPDRAAQTHTHGLTVPAAGSQDPGGLRAALRKPRASAFRPAALPPGHGMAFHLRVAPGVSLRPVSPDGVTGEPGLGRNLKGSF